jgi:hypothetical protein
LLSIALLPADTAAQQQGTLALGGSVTFVTAPDDDVRGLPRIGPILRYGESRDGWGARIGFNWYSADLVEDVSARPAPFGRLRVRPVTSFSLQPAFRDTYVETRGVESRLGLLRFLKTQSSGEPGSFWTLSCARYSARDASRARTC